MHLLVLKREHFLFLTGSRLAIWSQVPPEFLQQPPPPPRAGGPGRLGIIFLDGYLSKRELPDLEGSIPGLLTQPLPGFTCLSKTERTYKFSPVKALRKERGESPRPHFRQRELNLSFLLDLSLEY